MNLTTRKTYRIDWVSVWRSIEAILFGMFLGCSLAVLFFLGV